MREEKVFPCKNNEELQRLSNLCAAIGVVYDAVKKTEHIHEIKPKPAIEASGIQTLGDRRIMPFDHHEPVASQAFHNALSSILTESVGAIFGATNQSSL